MRYILHYTEPGDVVFDGFCGTGMTGIAAQLCGDKQVKAIIEKIKAEYGWMYQTRHSNILGDINYVVWSDVFICPNCTTEIVKRNLHNLAYFNSILDGRIKFILTGILNRSSKMNRIHLFYNSTN